MDIKAIIEKTPSYEHWKRIGFTKKTGVSVPLFSLRTSRDWGVGDIKDMQLMIDWCSEIGAEILQILPINDMGMDNVPYASISAFAVDPVYIALDEYPLADYYKKLQDDIDLPLTKPSNRVQWGEVKIHKLKTLKRVVKNIEGDFWREVDRFFDEHRWVRDYVVYRTLKDLHHYRSWEEWGYESLEEAENLAFQHKDLIRFYTFCQWVLDLQLKLVKSYAEKNGVFILGDIPILVGRDSSDVWRFRGYFDLQTSAGAPPDMYAKNGQKWGFPTYRWENLKRDGYSWWRERLAWAERYFHLYRIDHVVGFFRIWTIPYNAKDGREGRFIPEDEDQWGVQGREILTMMLESSKMLPVAEDLGTIPKICRQTLAELGICGMKVQRWEKRWEGDRKFIDPKDYPLLSVATFSTHDSETLCEWWEKNPLDRQELWEMLCCQGEAPQTLPRNFHMDLMSWMAGSNAIFVIHQIQDILSMLGLLKGDPSEHRINVPGTISPSNWSWRLPMNVETLLADKDIIHTLSSILKRKG